LRGSFPFGKLRVEEDGEEQVTAIAMALCWQPFCGVQNFPDRGSAGSFGL
jgi:hypothetical protein